MRNKASAIALMIGLGTVGIILTYGEAARACNTTETIAGIDFSDCKSISLGNNPPSVKQLDMRLARQLPIVIAQYNNNLTASYAQVAIARQLTTTQAGWNQPQIAYDRWVAATRLGTEKLVENQTQIALLPNSLHCPITNGPARYLGCAPTDTIREIARRE